MANSPSLAQRIAQTAIAFEEKRFGRKPASVMVALGGDMLLIAMRGVITPAEQTLAATPEGAERLRAYHQELFDVGSDTLRREIKRITGLEICEQSKQTAPAIQVFPFGTVVLVYKLAGSLTADSWNQT